MQDHATPPGRISGRNYRPSVTHHGRNDARFETIISTCFSPSIQFIHEGANGPKCKAAIESAEENLQDIMDDLEASIDKLLSERMAGNPSSQVVLSS